MILIATKSIPLEFDYFNFLYMRLDKYLWSIRFFKTRSIATDYCKKGHIKMNDLSCKPSREVYINDFFSIRKNQINYKIQVLGIPEAYSVLARYIRKRTFARFLARFLTRLLARCLAAKYSFYSSSITEHTRACNESLEN